MLGANRIVYMPDDDLVIYDARSEGSTLGDCIAELKRRWGPPQASVEMIDPEVVRATEHGVPTVWFVETIPKPCDSGEL